MINWTIQEDALLEVVCALRAELASMRQCFEAADRERSGLRDRAERAEAERDALRAALSGLLDAHARNVLYGGDHWENARAVLAEAK